MKQLTRINPKSPRRNLSALAFGALLGLGALMSFAQSAAQAQSQEQTAARPEQQKLAEIQNEFAKVNQEINTIQQKAIQSKKVQEKQDAYSLAMRSAMTEASPGTAKLLDEQSELLNNIRASGELSKPAEERSPEIMQQVSQYQQIEQQLAPQRQQVAQEPKVVEKREEFQRVLIAQMEKVDERAPALMDIRDQLIRQYEQMAQ